MEPTSLHYIQYLCEQKLIYFNLQEDAKYIDRLERELINIEILEIQNYILNLLNNEIKITTHSSLVYYLLGISDTDPVKSNQELKIRKQASFPDIDSDFSINEREQVIKYFIDNQKISRKFIKDVLPHFCYFRSF